MVVQDQREQIQFLLQPGAHRLAAGSVVERIDTHSAVIFLAGSNAYKLKRAVRYDYLDFSTADLRRRACEAEVSLNRRTAPDLYRGVRSVTRATDGHLELDGRGTPVDWLVHMHRFDNAGLMDRLAVAGQLDIGAMSSLAQEIARLHDGAERVGEPGGRDGMAWVVDGNARGFSEDGRGVLEQVECEHLVQLTRRALERATPALDRRRHHGFVRRCHGDLHLGNIVMREGRPVLFDAVEFNDLISCIDVLYDLAFVLMDLWRLTLERHANVLFNAYLSDACAADADLSQYDGLSLLPLFLSCRSAIRAKTSAAGSALQVDARRREALAQQARQYLHFARQFLETPAPQLVAIGGHSGSGKSTQARRLASSVGPPPGAVILRSDVLRKALFGVPERTRLGNDAYSPHVTEHVYDLLARRAAAVLAAGHSVIVDAAYERATERERIADVAVAAGRPFSGIWLEAPVRILTERVTERQGDASDATAAIVAAQLARDPGPMRWTVVDAAGTAERTEAAVTAELGLTRSA